MKRVVFLPSVPLSAISHTSFTVVYRRVSLEKLKNLLKYACGEGYKDCVFECYIRHESTVKLLNEILGLNLKPSADLYTFSDEDAVVVVSLKMPTRGAEAEVKPDDLDVAVVDVFEDAKKTRLEERANVACVSVCFWNGIENEKCDHMLNDEMYKCRARVMSRCLDLCEKELLG